MIDPTRVAFDIDGVIANTMQLFIDIGRDIHNCHNIQYQKMTRYDLSTCLEIEPHIIADIVERITDGNYACRLDPIPGAVEVLSRLKPFGPIRMVTARTKLGPIQDWMEGILSAEPGDLEIVATGSFEAKPDILKLQKIDFFVEDRLDTCYLLKEQDITPIVFVQPWNRQHHPFVEVDGWPQLDLLIDWQHGRQGAVQPSVSNDYAGRQAKGGR